MPKILARYTGNGYVFGVPAKDMTAAEWSEIPKERQDIALAAGTHEIAKEPPRVTKKEVNDDA